MHQVVVDADAGAAAAHLDQIFFQRFEVAVAQARGSHTRCGISSMPSKRVVPGEGEGHFVLVEDVEDEDVVAALAEHFQAAEQRFAVNEQIGDNNDQAATVDAFADAAEDFFDVGLLARPADVHRLDDGVDVVM